MFYKVSRYNLKGKSILSTQEKYYTADLGFKQTLLGTWQHSNLGHNLENIVYLELLRRGKTVYIGKIDDCEIDFVAITPGGDTEYIQVAWTAREESTLQRELRPFEKIKDFNKRTLLTMDVEPVSSFKGIKKINVVDWLLEK
jgi:predicted AAA+ superfamily ATPase